MRKVSVWASLMAVGTGLLWFGRIDSAQWIDLGKLGFSAFVLGNAMEYVPAALASVRGKSIQPE